MRNPFPATGGSNLVLWKYDEPNVPHGFIREFHLPTARPTITDQLQQMYANGQRKLGWAIAYYEGGDGYALDSTSGNLSPQDKQNLKDILTLAGEIGFGEFLVEMIPEWTAAWNDWANPAIMTSFGARYWQPREYGRNFEFTCQIDEVFANAKIPYRMDLLAEAIPGVDSWKPEDTALLLEYTQRMWQDWLAQKGGTAGSVGFSIIPTPDRVPMISKVYGSTLPDIFSIHPYADEGGWKTTADIWGGFKRLMKAAGYGQGYIWGETFTQSQEVVDAVNADRENLYYVLQWPVGTDTVSGATQDRLPLAYDLYQKAGF